MCIRGIGSIDQLIMDQSEFDLYQRLSKEISIRTVNRIVKEANDINWRTTNTRTEVECEYYYTIHFNLILLQLTNNLIIYSIFYTIKLQYHLSAVRI